MATAASAAKPAAAPVEVTPQEIGVIVSKKKKKKRYSRNIRGIQKMEVGLTKSQRRLAEAASKGIGAWIDARNKSAEKKRDGAIKDCVKNGSKAMRKALTTAAEAPADFLDEVAKMKSPF